MKSVAEKNKQIDSPWQKSNFDTKTNIKKQHFNLKHVGHRCNKFRDLKVYPSVFMIII